MTVFVGALYKYFVKCISYACYEIYNDYFLHKCFGWWGCWYLRSIEGTLMEFGFQESEDQVPVIIFFFFF